MPMSDLCLPAAVFGTLLALWTSTSTAQTEGAATDAVRGAHLATQCKERAACPLFDEVYATTPAFRHALSLSLRHGGERVPEWVKHKVSDAGGHRHAGPATATPMLPLAIDGEPFLLGRMTDPERADHLVAALYDTRIGAATVFYVNPDGNGALLGPDADILRRVMIDYMNPGSAFARSLAQPDLALPVPVSRRAE